MSWMPYIARVPFIYTRKRLVEATPTGIPTIPTDNIDAIAA